MNQMRLINKKGVQAALGARVGPAVISLLNILSIEQKRDSFCGQM